MEDLVIAKSSVTMSFGFVVFIIIMANVFDFQSVFFQSVFIQSVFLLRSSKFLQFILPPLKVNFACQKVNMLLFISSILILTLKVFYASMRVLRGFALDDKL